MNHGTGKGIAVTCGVQFDKWMLQVGATASIAQVAQLGTQLYLNLYRFAQSVGSANKVGKTLYGLQYPGSPHALGCAVDREGYVSLLSGTS